MLKPSEVIVTKEEEDFMNGNEVPSNNFTEVTGRQMDLDYVQPKVEMEESKMEESKQESTTQEPKQESNQKGNWLDEETKEVDAQGDFGPKLPSPVFGDGKVTIMNLDATKQFTKWTDPETKKVKAIIPCTSDIEQKVEKCNWWVNIKNPIYKEVIHKCREAQDKTSILVKIMQTGTQDKTRYTLIKE